MTSRLPSRRGPSQIIVAGLGHLDDARIEIDAIIDDMLCALLIPALFAITPVTARPALAQIEATPSESAPTANPNEKTLDQRMARWVRVLERVDEQLEANDISPAVLSDLEETADQVRDQIDAARGPIRSEVDRIGALINALGPPPKEGEPAGRRSPNGDGET